MSFHIRYIHDISCVNNALICALLINIIKHISGYLTPCSRVGLDKLVVFELVKKFLAYIVNEGLLPLSYNKRQRDSPSLRFIG